MRRLANFKFTLMFSVLALLVAPRTFAKSSPEIFTVKVKSTLERCVGDTKSRSLDCAKQAEGSKVDDIKISLSECSDKNTYGKNCNGSWEKELQIDGGKFRYFFYVSHFESAKFQYSVSLVICQENLSGDNCTRQTMYLNEKSLPYLTKLNGPNISKTDFRGGGGYDSAVVYRSVFEAGDGAGTGL
jgi:hypothetical protein